jgi:hypothetical protein
MAATTEAARPRPEDWPKLPEGLFDNALDGPSDPRQNPALLELIGLMLPCAMRLIREAFDDTKPRRAKAPTTGQMRELRDAQRVPLPDDDPEEEDPEVRAEIARRTQEAIDSATEAALRSAVGSFLGHWTKEFADVRSLNELAQHLIRITYNRYQRRRRGDNRLGRQAQSGSGTHAERSFLDSRPDRHENPAIEAEFREFLEIQQQLADGVLEGFSARDRQLILLYVAGKEPEEILGLINRHGKERKPCTLNTVRHVIENFKAQLDRLEEEDEPDAES